MASSEQSVEALFKLAGDTADLLVASSKSSKMANVSESLHNQLDIPAKANAPAAVSAPIARRTETPRVKIFSAVAATESYGKGGQVSTDLDVKLHSSAGKSSGLPAIPIKKKRGRPPKIRTQEGLVHSTMPPDVAPAPPVASAPPAPEVAQAQKSHRSPRHMNPIPVPALEVPAEKIASGRRYIIDFVCIIPFCRMHSGKSELINMCTFAHQQPFL